MTEVTDWIQLWRDLVLSAGCLHAGKRFREGDDAWKGHAETYLDRVRRRWAEPDSSRATILSRVKPADTVLDIGAGAGTWAVLLARHARHVTAVEPSAAMRETMAMFLEQEGIDNVSIVAGRWPDVDVPAHDHALCAHAMYGTEDLPAFVRAMEAAARRTCFMLVRAPVPDGVMAEAAREVLGHSHDSPNFFVACNALWQMGVFPDVRMEDTGLWGEWRHDSLAEALDAIKARLGVSSDRHDPFLEALLRRRLTQRDGVWVWPSGVRSALMMWEPTGSTGRVPRSGQPV